MINVISVNKSTGNTILKFAGLSTDPKPLEEYFSTKIKNGSVFAEIDTGLVYGYDEAGARWIEQPSGGGGTVNVDLAAELGNLKAILDKINGEVV